MSGEIESAAGSEEVRSDVRTLSMNANAIHAALTLRETTHRVVHWSGTPRPTRAQRLAAVEAQIALFDACDAATDDERDAGFAMFDNDPERRGYVPFRRYADVPTMREAQERTYRLMHETMVAGAVVRTDVVSALKVAWQARARAVWALTRVECGTWTAEAIERAHRCRREEEACREALDALAERECATVAELGEVTAALTDHREPLLFAVEWFLRIEERRAKKLAVGA